MCHAFRSVTMCRGWVRLETNVILLSRSELKCYRVNAAEAVRIHNDVRSRQSIAIGWGTWFRGAGIGQVSGIMNDSTDASFFSITWNQ